MKRDKFIRLAIFLLSLGGGTLAILVTRVWAQTLTLLGSVSWNW